MKCVESVDSGGYVTVNRGTRNVLKTFQIADGASEHFADKEENERQDD